MTLPETMTLIQLLDLVGKHVGLNYVYDPKEIPNQPIALKLHGDLRGEMKVKDLYSLLETVLSFLNLAMIRQEENLVAVVPMDKALQTQPQLVDGDAEAVQVGDTVVTRVFDIRHVEVASVMTLLAEYEAERRGHAPGRQQPAAGHLPCGPDEPHRATRGDDRSARPADGVPVPAALAMSGRRL